MKRHLAIFAMLAALAVPGLVRAEKTTAMAVEPGWVDASELANLLVAKGLITPEEQKQLTHSMAASSVDQRTLEDIFETEPYRGE